MRIWAFGTSPKGLGLSADEVWALTPREYFALREVWTEDLTRAARLQAELIAALYNVNSGADSIPWTADDLMDPASRGKKMAEDFQRKQMAAQIMAAASGDKIPVPDWALELESNRKKVN